jgi:hypothetical protein
LRRVSDERQGKLFFEYGSSLPDPDGLLLGGPKMRGRCLEFTSVKQVKKGVLGRFLADATVMKGL